MVISVGAAALVVWASGCFGWGSSVSGERPLNAGFEAWKARVGVSGLGFEV